MFATAKSPHHRRCAIAFKRDHSKSSNKERGYGTESADTTVTPSCPATAAFGSNISLCLPLPRRRTNATFDHDHSKRGKGERCNKSASAATTFALPWPAAAAFAAVTLLPAALAIFALSLRFCAAAFKRDNIKRVSSRCRQLRVEATAGCSWHQMPPRQHF